MPRSDPPPFLPLDWITPSFAHSFSREGHQRGVYDERRLSPTWRAMEAVRHPAVAVHVDECGAPTAANAAHRRTASHMT